MYWTPASPFPVPHSRVFRARISRGVRHRPVTVWSAVGRRLWLLEVGVVFLLMGMRRGERRELSPGVEIRERADVWWSSLLRTRFEDGAVEVAWDEFVRLFRAKFVPEHIRDKME
ncbi:hypothetical protein Taro_018978 [Colocasia esculenta]|uniref:Retrotransposon gag domain-containing protein n=1 Tax=Colocasia esculenta TaxID=4460 RepID=A0A843UXU2_COLES|nr:hypothetical protein [Colocasia esculenta]